MIEQEVPTRSGAQIRSHAQKYFTRLEQRNEEPPFPIAEYEPSPPGLKSGITPLKSVLLEALNGEQHTQMKSLIDTSANQLNQSDPVVEAQLKQLINKKETLLKDMASRHEVLSQNLDQLQIHIIASKALYF